MPTYSDDQLTERVRSSRRLYEGRIINARVDEVILPNQRVGLREIVEHPGAVAIVPLLDEHTVLLVRQYRHAAGEVLWEIPAGRFEPGEAPAACAAREIEEETGHRAGHLEKIYEVYVAPGYCMEVVHGYLATDLVPGSLQMDADEFVEVEAVPFAEALRMIDAMTIRDAKTVCGLLHLARRRAAESRS